MCQTARLTILYLFVSLIVLAVIPAPGSGSNAKGNEVALGCG